MGKPRKPIDMQKAHLTLVEKQNKEMEEAGVTVGNNHLRTPPGWLIDDVAEKEWRRIIRELKKIEIVGNLDYVNLGGYCNAYSNYVKATEILKDQEFCISRETRTGKIIVKNPMVDIQAGYAAEMRRFAALCGLTIDSRLKAAVTKTEKTEDMIKQKFGNI